MPKCKQVENPVSIDGLMDYYLQRAFLVASV